MSWFSTNYEKATLGAAVAIALGFAYLGWSKNAGVDQDFGADIGEGGNNNAAVANADLIPKALQSMKLDRTWSQAIDGDRPVNLFTGISLFIKSSNPEEPVDLFTDAPLHPPIPNSWWLENRLDPGFADSPSRDPDSDGFSNLEEFTAKTDPNDAKSHPLAIAKLMYVKDESLTWSLRPGSGSNGAFPMRYKDSMGRDNKMPAGEMVEPGGEFFPKAPMAKRFKLLGNDVRKEVNRFNQETDVTWVRIEDQKPNKKGVVYEFPSPLSENRVKDFLNYDRTAVLSLEALGYSGKEFKIEENTPFALPSQPSKKDYFLKKVSPDAITVEFTDDAGNRKTIEINKGTMPGMIE